MPTTQSRMHHRSYAYRERSAQSHVCGMIAISEVTLPYVLLKALPPVCMKYTARDESRVANMSAIFVTRLSSRAVYFHTNKVAVF